MDLHVTHEAIDAERAVTNKILEEQGCSKPLSIETYLKFDPLIGFEPDYCISRLK